MDGSLIYVKTPKGAAEVAARSALLTMTTRRVLIMDNASSIAVLTAMITPAVLISACGSMLAMNRAVIGCS